MSRLLWILVGLAASLPCSAQHWRVGHADGSYTLYTLDGNTLAVFDLLGNPIASHPIMPPYLYSLGALILPRPTNDSWYVSRATPTLPNSTSNSAQYTTQAAPASSKPTLLELDGRWYEINAVGFVQGIYLAGEFSFAGGSYENCRLMNGMPLPAPGAIRLKLGNGDIIQTVTLSSTELIYVQYLPNADAFRTGQHMADYALPGGRFLAECERLLQSDFRISFGDRIAKTVVRPALEVQTETTSIAHRSRVHTSWRMCPTKHPALIA
jgi:hypothetical protein